MEFLDKMTLQATINDPSLPEPLQIYRENKFDICDKILSSLPASNPAAFAKMIKKSSKYKTHVARVNAAYEVVEAEMKRMFDNPRSIGKSNIVSSKFRVSGNSQYVKGDYKLALQLYNKSICAAEIDSEELSQAYGNRSALFFRKGFYKECLKDIELAMALPTTSEDLKAKLLDRESNALRFLEENTSNEKQGYHDPIPEIPEDQRNPLIQNATKNVKLFYEESKGCHFVATQDLDAGELIYVEKTYAVYLYPKFTDMHCSHCTEKCWNLIPCKKCSNFTYCSEKCREEAFEYYHKFECNIFDSCKAGYLDDLHVLVLRCLFKGRDEYKDVHIDNFERSFSKSDIGKIPIHSDKFYDVFNLSNRMHKMDDNRIIEYSIVVAILFYLVKNHSNFFDQFTPNQNMEKKFKRYAFTLVVSFEDTLSIMKKFTVKGPMQIATGVGILQDFTYHSCADNMVPTCYGRYAVAKAKRVIKAGEECTVCYPDRDGISICYAEKPKYHRIQVLAEKFKTSCNCIACENDWPLKQKLPFISSTILPASQLSEIYRNIISGQIVYVRKIIPQLESAVKEMLKHEPNRMLFEAETYLRLCYIVLGNRDFSEI